MSDNFNETQFEKLGLSSWLIKKCKIFLEITDPAGQLSEKPHIVI
jgi:hypothetical protein